MTRPGARLSCLGLTTGEGALADPGGQSIPGKCGPPNFVLSLHIYDQREHLFPKAVGLVQLLKLPASSLSRQPVAQNQWGQDLCVLYNATTNLCLNQKFEPDTFG